MLSKNNKNLAIATATIGICTLILGLVTSLNFPSKANLSEGFRTPILAFEFAKTEADLSFLSGNGIIEKTNREKMDAGHRWDMAFPFAYGGFIILLLLQIIKRQRILWAGVLFAFLIIPFDINENLVLIKITKALSNTDSISTLLLELNIATWLKWGALGMSMFVLGTGYIKNNEYWSAMIAILTALSIGVCWVTSSNPVFVETMAIFSLVFFLFFTIKSSIQVWKIIRSGA